MRVDATARSIPAEELRGATITLSNFGMFGGRYASLVVVPPQVAIIGAGRVVQRVVAHQGAPAIRRMLPLSLTFDHRVVTGGEAARFLGALRSALEKPYRAARLTPPPTTRPRASPLTRISHATINRSISKCTLRRHI